MITHLVLLGATGDLAGRLVLPALARLLAAGEAGDDVVVVGAAPQDLDDAGLARHVAGRLDQHAADVPAAGRRALVERLRWARVDLDDPATVAAAVARAGDDAPLAVYLALPPAAFAPAIAALGAASLPAGSRVAVEKPFGVDAAGAAALNADLDRLAGAPEAVFRVDHALALPGVADLLARRGPGGDLARAWHGGTVEQVDVLWEETLGLEGRADFYDRAGASRDVAQNHLLQLLAVAVCELPDEPTDDAAWQVARLDVLRSLRPADDAPDRWTRRARYSAGPLAADGDSAAGEVPDYAAEDGVDPARGTETFAELVYVSTDPRWAGTRFVLRTGKAMAADHKAVVAHLRDDAPAVAGELPGRRVWVDLDERSETGERVDGQVSAYTRVLTEVLGGGSALSVSAQASEQAWRVVAPALAAWDAGAVTLVEYPAGSAGPERLGG